ncbi:MAG TPA: MarR family transcriptional regulator [Aggregatilineaceae bacterium]|nr:MarR family transcriptional regulator [Aggregatilineaceae bacterium]
MDNKLRFDGCMATNIEQAFHHLEKVYERLIGPLGLSLMEWYTLRALYGEDGVMASQLAQTVCRHPSSMTALLDRMEEKGLLDRQVDPVDRRSVRVFLTDAGRSYEARICESVDVIGHLLDTLVTPEQMDTFHYVLGVLQNAEFPQQTS